MAIAPCASRRVDEQDCWSSTKRGYSDGDAHSKPAPFTRKLLQTNSLQAQDLDGLESIPQ
jgi:hypothetical protein